MSSQILPGGGVIGGSKLYPVAKDGPSLGDIHGEGRLAHGFRIVRPCLRKDIFEEDPGGNESGRGMGCRIMAEFLVEPFPEFI